MLIVPIHSNVAWANLETAPRALALKPCDALITHRGEPMLGTGTPGMSLYRVHHDVVLDGAAFRWHASTNHGIGAQRESQLVSGFKLGCEPLGLRNVE